MSNQFFIMSYKDTQVWKMITDRLGHEPDLEELTAIAFGSFPDSEFSFHTVEDAVMWIQQKWDELLRRTMIIFVDDSNDKITIYKDFNKQ